MIMMVEQERYVKLLYESESIQDKLIPYREFKLQEDFFDRNMTLNECYNYSYAKGMLYAAQKTRIMYTEQKEETYLLDNMPKSDLFKDYDKTNMKFPILTNDQMIIKG